MQQLMYYMYGTSFFLVFSLILHILILCLEDFQVHYMVSKFCLNYIYGVIKSICTPCFKLQYWYYLLFTNIIFSIACTYKGQSPMYAPQLLNVIHCTDERMKTSQRTLRHTFLQLASLNPQFSCTSIEFVVNCHEIKRLILQDHEFGD